MHLSRNFVFRVIESQYKTSHGNPLARGLTEKDIFALRLGPMAKYSTWNIAGKSQQVVLHSIETNTLWKT